MNQGNVECTADKYLLQSSQYGRRGIAEAGGWRRVQMLAARLLVSEATSESCNRASADCIFQGKALA